MANASMPNSALSAPKFAMEESFQYSGPTAVHQASHRHAATASAHRAVAPMRAKALCCVRGRVCRSMLRLVVVRLLRVVAGLIMVLCLMWSLCLAVLETRYVRSFRSSPCVRRTCTVSCPSRGERCYRWLRSGHPHEGHSRLCPVVGLWGVDDGALFPSGVWCAVPV